MGMMCFSALLNWHEPIFYCHDSIFTWDRITNSVQQLAFCVHLAVCLGVLSTYVPIHQAHLFFTYLWFLCILIYLVNSHIPTRLTTSKGVKGYMYLYRKSYRRCCSPPAIVLPGPITDARFCVYPSRNKQVALKWTDNVFPLLCRNGSIVCSLYDNLPFSLTIPCERMKSCFFIL